MDGDTSSSNLPRRSVPHRPSSWDFAAKELTNLVKDDKRVTPMYYIFGSTIDEDFMLDFVNNVSIDRLTREANALSGPRTGRKNRWLEYATLTGYVETHGESLRRRKIVGTILSKKVFKNEAREPAHFKHFKNVLVEIFENENDLLLAEEGESEYDWVAYCAQSYSPSPSSARSKSVSFSKI
ncbi:hypothetical protein Tco_0158636 [Tanacetum coccineum]